MAEIIHSYIPMDCRLFDAGDIHAGPHGFHENAFASMIAEVEANPNARLILKGDLVDCITPDDWRFSSYSQDIKVGGRIPQDHADKLIKMLRPIAPQIIAILWGNHEIHILNTFDITRYMCKELGVTFGGYTAVVAFYNADHDGHLFKWLVTHGRKSISSAAKDPIQAAANKQAALKKHLSSLAFVDCIYMSMGHTHQLIVVKPTVNSEVILNTHMHHIEQSYRSPVEQNASYIPPECRFYVNSGSFLKTFADPGCLSYAECAQYGPVEIGCVETVVQGGVIVDVKKRLF